MPNLDESPAPESPGTVLPEAVSPDLASPDSNSPDPGSPAKTFRDFGIAEPICAALEAQGITTAFPIQALTLPVALDGHDLIGQARTGTGK